MPKTINPWEHVFIAGMTGSGKSYLAESYLASYEYVVKLDTKDEVTERRIKGENLWYGLREGKDFTVCRSLEELSTVETKKIIYVPDIDEQDDIHYDAFFKWIYERQNTIVWVDELMEVCPSALKFPFYLKAIYTRGRSKNIGCWALTQQPVNIPSFVYANSTHFFTFELQRFEDREKVSKSTGVPELKYTPTDKQHPFAFWYFRSGNKNATKGQIMKRKG